MLETRHDAVLIPQRAVQEIQGSFNVFTVTPDGVAHFTRIVPGTRVGPLWEVRSGLAAGDVVVIEGLLKVRDGVKVQPQSVAIDPTPVEKLRDLVPGARAGA